MRTPARQLAREALTPGAERALFAFLVGQMPRYPLFFSESEEQTCARRHLRRLVGTAERLAELDQGQHEERWRVWIIEGFAASCRIGGGP